MTTYQNVDRNGQGPAADLYRAAPAAFRQDEGNKMAVYFVSLFIDAAHAGNAESDMQELELGLTMFNLRPLFYRWGESYQCLVGYPGGDELPHLGPLVHRVFAQRLVGMEGQEGEKAGRGKGKGGKGGGRGKGKGGGGGGGGSGVGTCGAFVGGHLW